MSRRYLVSLRREVALVRRDEYDAAWAETRQTATALGAHAWRFAAAGRPEQCLEFLEFAADADPRAQPALAERLARLDAEFGAATVEEWEER